MNFSKNGYLLILYPGAYWRKGGKTMNYIALLNAFFWKKEKENLTCAAQCLYLNLFSLNNRYGWEPWFYVANSMLQGMAGLSKTQLDKARTELVKKKFIAYKKGSGSRAGQYHLVDLGTQTATQWTMQTGTQPDMQWEIQPVIQPEHSPGTRTKKKTNQTKQEGEARAMPPSVEEVKAFVEQTGSSVDPDLFVRYYQARGWRIGSHPMQSWQAMIKVWERREEQSAQSKPHNQALCYAQRSKAERTKLDELVQY